MVGLIANEGREDLKNVMNVVRFDPAKVTIGARGGEGRGGEGQIDSQPSVIRTPRLNEKAKGHNKVVNQLKIADNRII